MWKLSGDDILKAKEQLQERRAAVQAQYDGEMSRLDAELADIDRVEHFAVNFISNRKEDAPPVAVVEPAPVVLEVAPPAEAASEASLADKSPVEKSSVETSPVERSTDPEGEPAREQKGSRWRMRLGTVSETEAA